MTLKTLALALALAPAVALPADVAREAAAGDTVVARIGDYTLTRAGFDAMWSGLQPAQRAQFEQKGGPKALLESFIEQKLLAAEAMNRGIDRRPPIAATLESTRDTILSKVLLDDEVRDRVVTEKNMREYYDQHKAGFVIPELVEARHILATPFPDHQVTNTKGDDAKTEAEAKAKIERLMKEAAAGGSFEALARAWSEDVTASDGGRLEAFSRGRMSKAIEDAAFSLAVGKVSDVLRTPYGFHLLLVEKRHPERQQSFDEVKERVRAAVAQERRESFGPRYEQFLQELRAKIKVEVHGEALPAWTEAKPGADANAK